jgi:hypothetical protein
MPVKLGFYAEWLARWLACCLPGEEKLQDEALRDLDRRSIIVKRVRILIPHV